MALVIFGVIAAAFVACITLGLTQSYQKNDIVHASKFDSWRRNDEYYKVNILVNLTAPIRKVDRRFVSVTLDSNLVDIHWQHFDFRYDISYLCYLLYSF